MMPRCSHDARADWHFAAICKDVTPPDLHGDVGVLYAPMTLNEIATSICAAAISDAERERAAKFARPVDTARFMQRRAFRRFCGAVALGYPEPLSAIAVEQTSKGRPHFPKSPEHWFSFSSCGSGMIGAWSASYNVGVDLEDRTGNVDPLDIADQFFTEAEAREVTNAAEAARRRTFLDLWCVKEAALKSIGEGLSFELSAFAAELEPHLRLTAAPSCHGGPASFGAWRLSGTSASGVLVTRRRI